MKDNGTIAAIPGVRLTRRASKKIRRGIAAAAAMVVGAALLLTAARPAAQQTRGRNVIVFVADGLRPGSINDVDAPAIASLRTRGVNFENSFAAYPTLTMPNSAVIATGGRPGDTGVFGNTLWIGYASFESGNFNRGPASPVPFLESDTVLGDLDDHSDGGLFDRDTLLQRARRAGYRTAVIGKAGPTAAQDPDSVRASGGGFPSPGSATIVIDDAAGTAGAPALPPALIARLLGEGLSAEAPARSNGFGPTSPYNNAYTGDQTHGGTIAANTVQEQWFSDVTTRVVLPQFTADGTPFALVLWCRDPDGTQHNQGDSLGTLFPGINGPTSRLAVRNADRRLGQVLEWLHAHPAIEANTDVVVTSDHGFATISKREIDRFGHLTTSESARHTYFDANGAVDTDRGTLPYGFLAIDLALELRLNVFDPDRRVLDGGRSPFKRLRLTADVWDHPIAGNGLLGEMVTRSDGSDARYIVAANGGSDLVFVPSGQADLVRAAVEALLRQDYVGAVFVKDTYGAVPGTLPLSAIGLSGSARLPTPDIVVAFKVFYFNPGDLQTGVQVADTALQEGQGVHGGFGRESTRNTMIAAGPDFRTGFVNPLPSGNGDIAATLEFVMGFEDSPASARGHGRVLREALVAGERAAVPELRVLVAPGEGIPRTALVYQEVGGVRYLARACSLSKSTGPALDAAGTCR